MKLWKTAVIDSIGTAIYIALVALIMTYGNRFFGQATGLFGGIGILLLFTLSALIVGSLILGKPLMLYLDGQKKEAVRLLIDTIIILAIVTIVLLSLLALVKS